MEFTQIAFIEVFRWQSGISLKQNLSDIHHRFWNMTVASQIQLLLWPSISAMALDTLLIGLFDLGTPRLNSAPHSL